VHLALTGWCIVAAASRIAFIASLIACHAAGATDVIGRREPGAGSAQRPLLPKAGSSVPRSARSPR